MQACSLCASLPRTQSLERESARILQAGAASPGAAPRGPASLAERSELPGIVWVNSSTSGGGEVLDVRAKMRGVLRGDLQVSVGDGMLVVEARVHEPARDFAAAGRTYWHKFHVCLVGEEVDECGIRATFRDSVLEVKKKIPCRGNRRVSSATAVQTSLQASADRRLRPSHSPDSSTSSSDEVCLPYTGPLLQIFFLYLVLNPDQTDSGTGPAGRKVHNVTLPSRFPTRVATRRAGRNQAWVCGAGGRRVVRLAPPFCR